MEELYKSLASKSQKMLLRKQILIKYGILCPNCKVIFIFIFQNCTLFVGDFATTFGQMLTNKNTNLVQSADCCPI